MWCDVVRTRAILCHCAGTFSYYYHELRVHHLHRSAAALFAFPDACISTYAPISYSIALPQTDRFLFPFRPSSLAFTSAPRPTTP
jgi:hypothetical protein